MLESSVSSLKSGDQNMTSWKGPESKTVCCLQGRTQPGAIKKSWEDLWEKKISSHIFFPQKQIELTWLKCYKTGKKLHSVIQLLLT